MIGWIGSIAYVIAYLLLSLNKISSGKKLYHILNIIGAIGLIFNACYLNDYPNLAINIIWGIIAFIAMYGIRKTRSS
ncbi:hypothetical protein A4H97_22615 [Niastella yeongjuensis]|uniref:CBU-0592-like domain-containing protein n=1 Tax=Niastella yeongjuensis TaxID=354355 RepID=A0A1V9F7L8_9BACT|nr:hypothetical protein A4H97_22615 [Niastella yeongjuensis]